MSKQKILYLSILFILYLGLGAFILFSTDISAVFKFILFLLLVFSVHFSKKLIKNKTVKS